MNKKFGFTLIELLTVVVILGILTSIALPQYRKAIQRTETANALTNLKTIFDSAKRFKSTSSSWPTAFNQLDVDLLDISANGDMGEFRYGFTNENGGIASACRLVNGSTTNTYCLRAFYTRTVRAYTGNSWASTTQRDVYTCQYYSEKYRPLCESMCSDRVTISNATDECVI